MQTTLFESQLDMLQLIQRGKVRDLYTVDDEHLLIVTSDRISAFDVILPTPIPGKGVVLTELSRFWFKFIGDSIPNHLSHLPLEYVLPDDAERTQVAERAMLVRKLEPLPVEAIVRGYLAGSGWQDYQRTGAVCGIGLESGLQFASQLPDPIYTPSTKAEVGEHDENVDFAYTEKVLGPELAAQVRDKSLEIYCKARDYAARRGIVIADTKFEFGLDAHGQLTLIDEVLTPDSSRFWPADTWQPGQNPPSFDKQFVRDYLDTLDWDKQAPGPELPAEIVEKTAAKYREARQKLI